MYRLVVKHTLRLGLVVIFVVLALSACGGGGGGQQQQADEARPLPEDMQALRPGAYSSEEFKPSVFFSVGEGWTTDLESSSALSITHGQTAAFGFFNIQEVYKPSRTGSAGLMDAPEDLVGWFEQHPYLQTDEPEPVTVGGVEGVQSDVVVEDLPEDYFGACGTDCVDLWKDNEGNWWAFAAEYKERIIILENVQGETVTIDFGSTATEFDEFVPKAQKVLKTVEWEGT
jgi:hypothetical protein